MASSGDPFTNARAYFDTSFPSSGDPFSIAGFRNSFAGLGFMDMIPLQPRAHNPADKKIMVRGRDASSFYNPVYYGDANQRIPFASGDSPSMAAPASNPRLDIVYITPSGDIKVQTGTEAATPTLPTLAPSGDSRFPICAVWHKTTMTKIVDFQDKDSNSGDSYIYQDLRPWMRTAGAGAVALTSTAPLSASGSNTVGVATNAARQDHVHQGVHTVKRVGSGDMFGDIEIAGPDVTQGGQRINVGLNLSPKAWINFLGISGKVLESQGVASLVRNSAGSYTITWNVPFTTSTYCVVNAVGTGDVTNIFPRLGTLTKQTAVVESANTAGTLVDCDFMCVMAIGIQ